MIDSEKAAKAWLEEALPEANAQAIERLSSFSVMLTEENLRQNLVSRKSTECIWQRHIADSAQLLLHVPRETTSWLDLGSGAGFPGVVISILRPDCEVMLVESRTKRIEWLEMVCGALQLTRARVLGSRLENVPSRHVDVISARAFAPLQRLLELSARFSTSDTIWVLPKGRSAKQELDELDGWQHTFHVERSLTDDDAGIVVGRLTGRKGPAR